MHATLNGQRLWFDVQGERGAPVVLVMGFGISGRAWAPQVAALKEHHRTLYFDNRGVGESEPSRRPYGFTDLADDVVALLDHHGFERAHVVGVSMGGMVTQHVALRHPDRVASIALIATLPGGSLVHALPGARAVSLFLRANTLRGARRFAALRQLLYTRSYLERAVPEHGFSAGNLEVFASPAAASTRLHQLRAVLRHDLTRELGRVRAPTLVIKPEADILVSPENSERLHRLIPGSRMLRLPDAGHGATHQCADQINQALLEHFARAEDARVRADDDVAGGGRPPAT